MNEKCFDLSPSEIKQANQTDPVFTTREEFENALRQLGVHKNIKMVVHSSLGSLGKFEGGAENLCQCLMDMVSEDGLLMLPTLSWYPKDGEDFTYDPENTVVSTGIIPETFRKLPGVVRSLDPTHSMSVWGKDKLDYIRHHHQLPTMHRNSPLGLLEQAGGYCLLIGCWTSTTFMHVVETSCHAPCLGSRTEEYKAIINGRQVKLRAWNWRGGYCRGLRHEELFGFMRQNNTLHECMLKRCHLMFFKLSDYRTAYSRLLLAPEGGCAGCPVRPRQVKQCVPSDWDEATDTLKPSDAFTEDVF